MIENVQDFNKMYNLLLFDVIYGVFLLLFVRQIFLHFGNCEIFTLFKTEDDTFLMVTQTEV